VYKNTSEWFQNIYYAFGEPHVYKCNVCSLLLPRIAREIFETEYITWKNNETIKRSLS